MSNCQIKIAYLFFHMHKASDCHFQLIILLHVCYVYVYSVHLLYGKYSNIDFCILSCLLKHLSAFINVK